MTQNANAIFMYSSHETPHITGKIWISFAFLYCTGKAEKFTYLDQGDKNTKLPGRLSKSQKM